MMESLTRSTLEADFDLRENSHWSISANFLCLSIDYILSNLNKEN